MRTVAIVVGGVFSVVALTIGMVCLLESGDVFRERMFGPLHEKARRETFEQSRAYREGMAQDLQAMQFEYARATPPQKEALASVILHRTASVDPQALPADLRQFVYELRAQRGAQ